MDADFSKSEEQKSCFLELQGSCAATKSIPSEGKFVIVYLHGLTMDVHETDSLVEACQKTFCDKVINIQPKCKEGLKSIYRTSTKSC